MSRELNRLRAWLPYATWLQWRQSRCGELTVKESRRRLNGFAKTVLWRRIWSGEVHSKCCWGRRERVTWLNLFWWVARRDHAVCDRNVKLDDGALVGQWCASRLWKRVMRGKEDCTCCRSDFEWHNEFICKAGNEWRTCREYERKWNAYHWYNAIRQWEWIISPAHLPNLQWNGLQIEKSNYWSIWMDIKQSCVCVLFIMWKNVRRTDSSCKIKNHTRRCPLTMISNRILLLCQLWRSLKLRWERLLKWFERRLKTPSSRNEGILLKHFDLKRRHEGGRGYQFSAHLKISKSYNIVVFGT